MGQFSLMAWLRVLAVIGTVALISGQSTSANETNSRSDGGDRAKKAGRMNCGAKIECMTPDGHAGHISRLPEPDPGATALIMEDDTVTCLLQEGETNFVIELPQFASLDRFTFLNENAAARGELKISVSNQRLAANSVEWTDVEGVIPFAHKRLFGVSLLGIEAKYVRLSFRVEKQGQIAAAASFTEKSRVQASDTKFESAPPTQRFQASALQDALDSKFAALHARGSAVLLSCISTSVAPLPTD
jgi:hypothetical protein